MTTLQIDLPDSLATEAQQAGLLNSETIGALLREAMRERRIAQLVEARKRIAASGLPPLTMEEIQAEVAADRAGWREQSGRATRP